MAYTVDHGPPALDALHQWDPAAGDAPPVLNDVNDDGLVLPGIRVGRIVNWRGRAEIVNNSAPVTFGVGEKFYPERRLGKTLVYECRLECDDRQDFLLEQNAIVQGFADEGIGTMTVTPWATPGGIVWTYTAKVLDLSEAENWELDNIGPIAYVWPFTLTLRMTDAKFYTDGSGYY